MEQLENEFYINKRMDRSLELFLDDENINYISNKIQFLHMNMNITNDITNLSSSIKSLLFNDNFNQKIKLPSKLSKLCMGNSFNKKIKFSNTIEILIIGKDYAYNYDNLPKLLKKISFRTSLKYLKSSRPETRVNSQGDLITKMYLRITLSSLRGCTEKIIINKYEYKEQYKQCFDNYCSLNNLPQLLSIILEDNYSKFNYSPQSLKQLTVGKQRTEYFEYFGYFDNISQNMETLILIEKHENKIRKTPLKLKRIIFISKKQDNNIKSIFRKSNIIFGKKNIIEVVFNGACDFGRKINFSVGNDSRNKDNDFYSEIFHKNIKLISTNKFDDYILNE
jgi:hypothetical protein